MASITIRRLEDATKERLRIRVAGTAEAGWFLEGGRLAEQSIRAALGRAGTTLEERSAILDA